MDAILKNNFQNILAGYQKVADYTVSGSAITNYDFSSLVIGKEDDYILVSDISNTSSNSGLYLFANGNTTLINYYSQELVANGTSVVAGRYNNSYVSSVQNNQKTLFISNIKLTNNGVFVSQTSSNYHYSSTAMALTKTGMSSTFTMTSITSLRIASSVSNGLGIGSRFQLYKRVAPIVADITVSSATTSVDITGLSIDKNSEYMLVSDIVNASAGAWNGVFANANYTSTNYYVQMLNADGAAIQGSRENTSNFNYNAGANKNLVYMGIKLTNNGFIELQVSDARMYGANTIALTNYVISSTFTASSITSLRIASNVANGIGVGSRFQLIKLK